MNNYKKKLIFILIAASMILSSCSLSNVPQDSSSGGADSVAADESSVQQEGAEEKAEDKEEKEDGDKENGGAEIDAAVEFSMESGFYSEPVELELSCGAPGTQIYYTTDGSVPTKDDLLYSKPIKLENRTSFPNVLSAQGGISAGGDNLPWADVDKCNVIRAAAFDNDGNMGQVVSHSYFVGIDREKKYTDVPVISLMTDMDNLFDYEKGIYVLGKAHDDWLAEDPANKNKEAWAQVGNYSMRGKEWERPVYVEYINFDGSVGFGQEMGMRIMGAASRNENQKSFRITARAEYGDKSVQYEMIPDNLRSDGNGNVEKYKSFVLRNGGNDCNFAKIRDPYLQSLVSDKDIETMQYTPVVVFLDGEFWGMYTLAEDYSDNYIENNYGIDNKNVVMIKKGEIEEGEEEDYALYSDMYEFITDNDMSDSGNYARACEMLDMQDFADYCAFNIYIYNEDSIFENNNWRMWRVREAEDTSPKADCKWRTLIYDTDYSTGIYNGGSNFNMNNIRTAIQGGKPAGENEQPPAKLLRALLENEEFKQMFVISLCDMRNISFETGRASAKLEEMKEQYRKITNATFDRFGPFYADFSGNINGLKSFMTGRYTSFIKLVNDSFSLGDTAEVSVMAADGGRVMVNTTYIEPDSDYKGSYFTCYPITLTAEPEEGKSFVRWECSGCSADDTGAQTAVFTFEGDCEITPVFE